MLVKCRNDVHAAADWVSCVPVGNLQHPHLLTGLVDNLLLLGNGEITSQHATKLWFCHTVFGMFLFPRLNCQGRVLCRYPREEPSVFIDKSRRYTFRPKAFRACEERYKVRGNVQKNLQSAVEVLEFLLFISSWEFGRDNRKVLRGTEFSQFSSL